MQLTTRQSRCAHAFTLIELILVLTLLAVMVSLVAPALAGFFRGRVLDSEARRLLSLTRTAQSRAVSSGMPMQLWFDAQNNTYGLREESLSGKDDPRAVTLDVDASLHVQVPDSSTVSVAGNKLPAIRFLPDGYIDEDSPQKLQVAGADGSFWLVESRNRTGYEIHNNSQ
jgi:type II secretion system protein H